MRSLAVYIIGLAAVAGLICLRAYRSHLPVWARLGTIALVVCLLLGVVIYRWWQDWKMVR